MKIDRMNFSLTRLAPTPSGYLHLGNVLSFAITASLARKTNAGILLRIDDLDQNRIRKEYVEDIFDTLRFLEIPWNMGPMNYAEYQREHSQLHRLPQYQKALEHLRASGQIFACNCSRKQISKASPEGIYAGTCREKSLDLDQKPINWRLVTPRDKTIRLKNLNGTHSSSSFPPAMKDFVIRKKDQMPAYQLSSLMDDIHFGIDLIVRGEDLWDSSLAQVYLSELLPKNQFKEAHFYHHPLVMLDQGQKLSKSQGATSIQYLRKSGKTKEDIYTMLGHFMRFPGTVRNLSEFQSFLS